MKESKTKEVKIREEEKIKSNKRSEERKEEKYEIKFEFYYRTL